MSRIPRATTWAGSATRHTRSTRLRKEKTGSRLSSGMSRTSRCSVMSTVNTPVYVPKRGDGISSPLRTVRDGPPSRTRTSARPGPGGRTGLVSRHLGSVSLDSTGS